MLIRSLRMSNANALFYANKKRAFSLDVTRVVSWWPAAVVVLGLTLSAVWSICLFWLAISSFV